MTWLKLWWFLLKYSTRHSTNPLILGSNPSVCRNFALKILTLDFLSSLSGQHARFQDFSNNISRQVLFSNKIVLASKYVLPPKNSKKVIRHKSTTKIKRNRKTNARYATSILHHSQPFLFKNESRRLSKILNF